MLPEFLMERFQLVFVEKIESKNLDKFNHKLIGILGRSRIGSEGRA